MIIQISENFGRLSASKASTESDFEKKPYLLLVRNAWLFRDGRTMVS